MVTIDINGKAKPNEQGTDRFNYNLYNDGSLRETYRTAVNAEALEESDIKMVYLPEAVPSTNEEVVIKTPTEKKEDEKGIQDNQEQENQNTEVDNSKCKCKAMDLSSVCSGYPDAKPWTLKVYKTKQGCYYWKGPGLHLTTNSDYPATASICKGAVEIFSEGLTLDEYRDMFYAAKGSKSWCNYVKKSLDSCCGAAIYILYSDSDTKRQVKSCGITYEYLKKLSDSPDWNRAIENFK